MELHLHQAQLAGLKFHNVAINGVRSEHAKAVCVLLTDKAASIELLHDLLGLLRSLANHLVLHRENIVRLNLTEKVATKVDTIMKASGRISTGRWMRPTSSRPHPCSMLCQIRQSPG